ncbi:hypothetical protein EYF80_031021 [Liparis tanakae]|uniref:Uncharacterized protein n=1 Tax=Liparis tanakae TaxID=230148 RepID=A0A4Z2GZ24_9TELE|nr:hypothetical protein EYF80_031021 [Liparis tanakae]
MKVTISPSVKVSASAPSTRTRGPYQTFFMPTSAFWMDNRHEVTMASETSTLGDGDRNHVGAGQSCVPGSYRLHLLRRRVVNVGFALSEQLIRKSHDGVKMVTGEGELVWVDLEHGNVFQDNLRRLVSSKRMMSLPLKVIW